MIINCPRSAFDSLAREQWPITRAAFARGVFLIQPDGMWLSAESASDNVYMDLEKRIDPERALAQHRALAQAIRAVGVPVVMFPGDPLTPDAVFPNNVFGTAAPDRFIIGAMHHPGRQREADRDDVAAVFCDWMAYRRVDLRTRKVTAELTGSLVIDRGRGIGFCGMTERVDAEGLAAMHDAFDLKLSLGFDLKASEYHTNVVMSVLSSRAMVFNRESLVDRDWATALARPYGDRVLWIDDEEKAEFVGNCIALTENDLFLSTRAERGLSAANRRRLQDWGFRLHAVELDEIEKAGGSLRCCVAEIY